jgi:hypothetical protein
MGAMKTYLSQHPWQRRLMTSMIVMLAAIGATLVAYPYVQDYLLLRRLGSPDRALRDMAIRQAIGTVQQDEHVLKFLNSSMDASDDTTFESIALVLTRVHKFNIPGRDPSQLDRYNVLLMLGSSSPQSRLNFLRNLLLNGRDNPYIRHAAREVVKDDWPEVRQLGAVLAASLGEDDALKTALLDADPSVQGWAALAAGLADRKATEEVIAKVFTDRCQAATTRPANDYTTTAPGATSAPALDQPATDSAGTSTQPRAAVPHAASTRPRTTSAAATEPKPISLSRPASEPASAPALSPVEGDREVISAAAFALARFDPAKYAPAVAQEVSATRDPLLRERLLHVLGLCDKKIAAPLVAAMLAQAKDSPSPALLLAAGKLGLREAEGSIRTILRDVVLPNKPQPVPLVRAALQAAGDLHLSLAPELSDFCRKLWYPREEPSLMAAARLLGEQPPDASGKYPPARVNLLGSYARYIWLPSPDADPETQGKYTPFASAAAAVALWQMKASIADETVKDAVDLAPQARLPAHYVAWHLARIDPERAFRLGLTMLPPLDAPVDQREDRDNVRTCGAMTLALAARTPEQKKQAVERIQSRLEDEKDRNILWSYKAALLILGQSENFDTVAALLDIEGFPLRVTTLAMTAAGSRRALDGLLWNFDDDDLATVLINQCGLDVLNAVHGLPRIDPAAYGDLLNWQMRIVRCGYAAHRADPVKLDYQGR